MSWWHNLPAELKQTGPPAPRDTAGHGDEGAAEKQKPAATAPVADHFVGRLFGKQAGPLGALVLDRGPRPKTTAAAPSAAAEAAPAHPVPELKAAALLRKQPKTSAAAAAAPAPSAAIQTAVERRAPQQPASPAAAAPPPPPAVVAPMRREEEVVALPLTVVERPVAPPAPPMPPADPLDWTISDADRNGSFFLEWRITAPGLAAALAKVQKDLQTAAGANNLVVLQSCAADNLHVTMNEWTMTSAAEARRAREALAEFSASVVAPRLADGPPAILQSVEHFNERVWYVPIVGPGLEALQLIYRLAAAFLTEKGFKLKPTKGGTGELTAHITLGKTRPTTGKPAAIHSAIGAMGLKGREIGRMPVREVVFCVKRRKAEAQPPVLLALPAPTPTPGQPPPSSMHPVASALVVMPPKSEWAPFVQIKRRHHDPRIKRPPYPHVTLLASAPHPSPAFAERAERAFGATAPFAAAFEAFTLFERPRTDSATLYLEPRCTLGGSFEKLREVAVEVLTTPAADTFEPHLAVGLIRGLGEARRLKAQYQAGWRPLQFPVQEVYHITRTSNDAPWVVAAVYALKGHSGAPAAVAIGETTDSGFVPATA